MSNEIRLSSPAKVNLALSVGAPRSDGYHPIASWMVAVDFADELVLQRVSGEAGAGAFDIAFAADAPQPQPVDWPIEKDLGWRALRLLEEAVGRPLPVSVTVRKRVPAGAGLGGGSGNAAAVLVGVDRLFELRLGEDRLTDLATRLGCDVAFVVAALHGRPSALATGLGEKLTPMPLPRPIHLVLLLPPLTCPTGPVYRQFDALRPDAAVQEARVRQLAEDGSTDAVLFNDLADPAMAVTPPLQALRDRLVAALKRTVHVTGSGAAMFVLARDADDSRRLAELATAATGTPAVPTATLT